MPVIKMPKVIKRSELEFHTALKKVMGIHDIKTKHSKSTELSGVDSFVSLPTGYGKSIVFTILSLLRFVV